MAKKRNGSGNGGYGGDRQAAPNPVVKLVAELEAAVACLQQERSVLQARIVELEKGLAEASASTIVRRPLPSERKSKTRKFTIGDLELYVIVGLYDDGSPGEIFFRGAKFGSLESGILDGVAIAISRGLQSGVPLEAYATKLMHMRFPPEGLTGDPDYPVVNSILDYVAKWLVDKFVPKKKDEA